MSNIRALLDHLAIQEETLQQRVFVSPCVPGGQIRIWLSGLVQSLTPWPQDFEGWGVFRCSNANRTAKLQRRASLEQIEIYQQRLLKMRWILIWCLRSTTWLGYPALEENARQHWGTPRPMPIYLVQEGCPFETVYARFDGASWWFEMLDRRVDPWIAEQLQTASRKKAKPASLQIQGLSPELRCAFSMAYQRSQKYLEKHRTVQDHNRLSKALSVGGGTLQGFRDRGKYWVVRWSTSNGEEHHSAIGKQDLTVFSAGICLDDQDRDFDLQSLVGVVEGQTEDW